MAPDPRTIELFSYYRDAELHGAGLFVRLTKMLADDPDAQMELSRHVADDTHHAWLWTKRITDLGAKPPPIGEGYQSRIGLRTLPRKLVDLLALTVVFEERIFERYREHAARPDVDRETKSILEEITKDQNRHVAWIKRKLDELAAEQGMQDRIAELMEKYRQIDDEAYGELRAKEAAAFSELH